MHFTVTVVHDKNQIIDNLLAPFQDKDIEDCSKENLKFDDRTEEIHNHYSSMDENKKAKYPTFDDYVTNYWAANKHEKRYGYFYNPNSQWDWYQIGGRWAGFFLMKPDKKENGIKGEPSLINKNFIYPENYADSACISDIDFEGMRNKAEKSARIKYKKIMNLIKDCPPFEPLEYFELKFANKERFGSPINLYNSQEAIIKFRRSEYSDIFDLLENYTTITEDIHAFNVKNRVASSFAWLENGEWTLSDSGFMQDSKEWNQIISNNYERLLKESPEKWVTIVDCHT